MTFNATAIIDTALSHAQASGWFDKVNGHEPKNAPGNGLTLAVWAQSLGPVPGASGLRSTTARLVLNVRAYSSMIQEPQDAIDPNLLAATDALMTAYSGDFDFGANVRNVDLLGAYGVGLSATAGYLTQDGRIFRVMTITVPLIINDVWSQTP